MLPNEWPIAPSQEEEGLTPARRAGRTRLATVCADFFLDPNDRLTEQERALMSAMLAELVGGIAVELRASLPSGWSVANDDDGHRLARTLGQAGLINRTDLIGALLRRADEERIAMAFRARSSARPAFLQAMISDSNAEVAAAAMALILARGRRHDRIGHPRVDFDDLPPRLARSLSLAVAAVLAVDRSGPAASSRIAPQFVAAVDELMGRHSRTRGVDEITQTLVEALDAEGQLDEDCLAGAAEEGDLAFLSMALAQRAGLPGAIAWDHLLDARNSGFSLLMRMAGVSRDLAARLLAALSDLLGIADPGAEISRFEQFEDSEMETARAKLHVDPEYRAAIEAVEAVRG